MKKIQEKNVLEVCNEVENNERILNIFLEVYNELDEIMNTFVNTDNIHCDKYSKV